MIEIAEVLEIHETLIIHFGGSRGLRDRAALESGLARPFQQFEGKDLYPSAIEKGAAIVESILVNHPFIDGNKRTGYSLLRLFLDVHEIEITASAANKYEFIINIASGTLKFDGIVDWLKLNTRKKNGG